MLTSLLIVALAQPGLVRMEPRRSGDANPFFEFAPASGTGMGIACACALPTGSKGETMTFTRASSGTCLKTVGAAPQSIANGDMVTCTSGQARVMPGTDGTALNGILTEEARTNSWLRSQEIDNVATQKINGGAAGVPVVTADQATAPDGTVTADRVQFPATNGAQYSALYQTPTSPAGQWSCSFFVKGNGSAGTLDMCMFNGGGYSCLAGGCAYTTSSWTRCKMENATTASTFDVLFGNLTNVTGGVTRPAQDVFMWGLQCEAGIFASSYVATTSAAVTRAADSITTTVPAGLFDAHGSSAASVVMNDPTGTVGGIFAFGGSNRPLYLGNGVGKTTMYDSTTILQTGAGAAFNLTHRLWSSWSGASMTVTNVTDVLTATGSFDGIMMDGSTTLELCGGVGGGGPFNGVCKRMCFDPNPSRCR